MAGGILLAVAAVAGTVALVPAIRDSKREAAERERVELRRSQAAERRRLLAEQRPVRGRLDGSGRADLVRLLEAAVFDEAQARVSRGELQTRVKRGDCRIIGRERGRSQVSCVAVTTDIPPTPDSRGGVSGYPFIGLLDLESGRYAVCKTSGRPAEGALGRGQQVELPRECGGTG